MVKSKFASLILILMPFVLVGCLATVQLGNINDAMSNNRNGGQANQPRERPEGCDVYIRPGYLPIPDLPDLPDRHVTAEELDIIQAQHIKELRQFILDEREMRDTYYIQYINKCAK